MPRKFLYKLPEVLEPPSIPDNIEKDAMWLSGEGSGSWFVISENQDGELIVRRYNQIGAFECEKTYRVLSGFDFRSDYSITYPSFCNKITFLQDGRKITLIE